MSNRQQAKPFSLPLYPSEPARADATGAGATPAGAPAAVLAERLDVAADAGVATTFETLRQRAVGENGRRYWRSLQELADTPEFAEYVQREFPQQAGEWHDPVSRRHFIKLMGASLALAGVGLTAGCEREEKIVPYVNPPENLIPGRPLYYATAMPFRGGQAIGVLVEQHMGRPTKIEGNPEHPASLGATDAMTQASILSLYDPDRSQALQEASQPTTWGQFFERMDRELYKNGKPLANVRLRVLTETVCSPTLAANIQALTDQFANAKWHRYEPVNRDNVTAGAQAAFGQATNTYYDFTKAERVLSLDCNFLHDEPGSIRYARQFVDGRRVRVTEHDGSKHVFRENASKIASEMKPVEGGFAMNRLYVVESTPTITGAMADHREPLKPSQVYDFAAAVARAVGAAAVPAAGTEQAGLSASATKLVDAAAADLKDHAGKCLVIAGDHQPPAVHVLAHAINAQLQNVGQTVFYTDPVEGIPAGASQPAGETQLQSLTTLVKDMNAGQVDVLLILGGNPVFTAPADLDFQAALDKFVAEKLPDDVKRFARLAIHVSPYYDETSFRCHWHLPESHYLESWGDLRAFDGTVAIQQPLISPLYGTRSALEVIAGLLRMPDATGYDLVRKHWQDQEKYAGDDFEQAWRKALHDGVLADSALPPRPAALAGDLATAVTRPQTPTLANSLEIVFRPDPHIWDGRWANNGWLQETPKPLTKLTWDNVILMSAPTAQKLGYESVYGDDRHRPQITVRRGNREITGAIWISYGHPDDSLTVHLGFGRERAGRVGGMGTDTHGFNAYTIRTSDALHIAADVTFGDNKGKTYELACTQHHQVMDLPREASGPAAGENLNKQRDLVRVLDYSELAKGAEPHHKAPHLSLYPDYDYDGNGLHKWGMVIDQNACMGCNACITACQSENNTAVVGKKEVIMQREMHWLRIDTYYTGDPISPEMMFQPMLCQHCESAPCEVVCPVAATTHSDEGINEMTYNRCVGTRYCSNNCPYKVRRFNFLQYNDNSILSLKLMRNPDVTVRNRGVMEKCTYCVQRVNGTRIELKKLEVELSEAQKPASGFTPQETQRIQERYRSALTNLQTACQQVCPTEAIVFGDLNAGKKFESVGLPKTELPVHHLKHQSDDVEYGLLTELNTKPRTTYLARFRNSNPALGAPTSGEAPKEPGHA